jgi:hypothetical protein
MKSCLLLVIAFADPSYFHLQQSNLCSCANPVFLIFSMSSECSILFLGLTDLFIDSVIHFLEDTQQGYLSLVEDLDFKSDSNLQFSKLE